MHKFNAQLKSTSAETKSPYGSFEAILSVPTVDRDKEVVDAGAFDPLPAKITIDVDHQMSVEKTIGSGRPYYDGAVLKFEGTYASHPLAQMVRSLVDEGHIDSMSVAYHQSVYEVDEKDGLPHLRHAELLNAGIVGIPSNRQALITASKSLVADVLAGVENEEETVKAVPVINVNGVLDGPKVGRQIAKLLDVQTGRAVEATADIKNLQIAHDALCAAGATCTQKSSSTDDETTTDTVKAADTAAATVKVPAAVVPAVNVNVALAQAQSISARAALTLL